MARVPGRGCGPWPHDAMAYQRVPVRLHVGCAAHVAACGSWQAVVECGWMSICCPLRVQPANLISLVSILFCVLLCQVLVCQSQKELKVSALPACTHARIRAVP